MTTAAWIAIGVLWLVVLVLAAAVLALARQIGVLHERLQPVGALSLAKHLKAGEAAPPLDLTTIDGQPLHLGGPQPHGATTLVMFVAPSCPVCKSLLPALRALRQQERPRVDIVLASDGTRSEHLDFVQAESLQQFPYVLSEALGIAYGASRLPHAVLIDGAGIVRATGLVNSREHLDSLLEARDLGVGTVQDYLQQREAPAPAWRTE
jgi:methylamine dehydrogenase accessory protein MauD